MILETSHYMLGPSYYLYNARVVLLPDIEDGGQSGYVDRQLDVPPVLHDLGNGRQHDDTRRPERLDHAARQGAVLRREQFHHHGVSDTLKTLEKTLNAG